MRKTLKITALILIFGLILGGAAFAESKRMNGAVAKLPYPLAHRDITLKKQKVDITVYSTFIEVEGEYTVQNNTPNEMTAMIGFPVYRHGGDPAMGEMPPIDLKVSYGKKDDYFVKKKIEGNPDSMSFYKEWYMWNVDIRGKRSQTFKMHYFLKLKREKGIPHFGYSLKPVKAYTGGIGDSIITVDMPIKCGDLSFTTKKIYSGDKYLYTSIARPHVSGNELTWSNQDFQPDRDLEVYFYKNGFPDWEVTSSNEAVRGPYAAVKVLDGLVKTCWMSISLDNGMGSWLQFQPILRYRDGKTGSFSPMVYQMGVVPGNVEDLSKFYGYSHLMEAEVEAYAAPKKAEKTETAEESGEPAVPDIDRPMAIRTDKDVLDETHRRKEKRPGTILMECAADPILQIFKHHAKPIETKLTPIRMKTTMVYPGQKHKELCIGEVLIFDRKPGEVYEW